MEDYIYRQVAEYVRLHPDGVTRSEISKKLGVGKGTALFHLEQGIKYGLLIKVYTFTGNNHQRGWVYYPPAASHA